MAYPIPTNPEPRSPYLAVARATDAAKRPSAEVKKFGFAPASYLFPSISNFGFGFKLALIGFRVRPRGFCLLLRPGIPPRVGVDRFRIH